MLWVLVLWLNVLVCSLVLTINLTYKHQCLEDTMTLNKNHSYNRKVYNYLKLNWRAFWIIVFLSLVEITYFENGATVSFMIECQNIAPCDYWWTLHTNINMWKTVWPRNKIHSYIQKLYKLFESKWNGISNNYVSLIRGNNLFWEWCKFYFYD